MKRLARVWLILLLAGAGAVAAFGEAGVETNLARVLEGPTPAHGCGTDSLGRDLCARLLRGAPVSLAVGVGGALIAVGAGAFLGLIGGWWQRFAGRAIMRVTDVLYSVPSFALVAVFLIGFQSALPVADENLRVMVSLMLAVGLTGWMSTARVVRALVLREKTLPFVEAARALGASDLQILRRHVVPAIRPAVAVLLGIQVPASILYESFMSFIGVGIQPPQTSWGVLIHEGWSSLATSPHLILFPSLVLFLTVWSLHEIFDRGHSFTDEAEIDTLGQRAQIGGH